MKITIEGIKLDVTPALTLYIEKKLQPLGGLIGKLEEKGESDIFLEISRTTKHHQKGLVFRAEANLRFGKRLLRAEANGENARSAIDAMKDELRREIVHFKERVVTKARRGDLQVQKGVRLS